MEQIKGGIETTEEIKATVDEVPQVNIDIDTVEPLSATIDEVAQIDADVDVPTSIEASVDEVPQIDGEIEASRVYTVTNKLSELSDVELYEYKQNGQILTYENGKWKNEFPPFRLTGADSRFFDHIDTSSGSTLIFNTKYDGIMSTLGDSYNNYFLKGNSSNGIGIEWGIITWEDVNITPVTLNGYGILDAYTKTEVENALRQKISEPSNDGTSGQVLATDGHGGRYWKTASEQGGTSNYSELSNKPQINGYELNGNKTATQLGLATNVDVLMLETEKADKSSTLQLPRTIYNDFMPIGYNGNVVWKDVFGERVTYKTSDIEASIYANDEHIPNAYAIKHYSNRYTESVIATVPSGQNELTIVDDKFSNPDVSFEFFVEPTFNEETEESETLTLARFVYDDSIKTMILYFVETPSANTRIRIDLTMYRNTSDVTESEA